MKTVLLVVATMLTCAVGYSIAGIKVDYARVQSLATIPQIDRAVAATLLDEINSTRAWLQSLKTAIATCKDIEELKASVAHLPDLPARKTDQLAAAISEKMIDPKTTEVAKP
jgi:hypothetical protein